MTTHHFARLALLCVTILTMVTAGASAADYPDKPIRIIVPYPPGGSTDTVARVYAEQLYPLLGQRFVIENRPGAAGAIGLEAAAKSPADGYTLVLGTASTQGVIPLIRQLPYDAQKDFEPISLVSDAPIVLSANPDLPVKTLRELIDYSIKNPEKLNFGSDGQASLTHMAGELLKSMTGLKMQHVPYKGTAQAVSDVVAGQIQLSMNGVTAAIGLARDGRLRVLATGGTKRVAQLPDVPTMAEAGVAGYDVASWFALFAPAGTDRAIIERLNQEIRKVAEMPKTAAMLEAAGSVPVASTPAQLGARIAAEREQWTRIIRDAKISAE